MITHQAPPHPALKNFILRYVYYSAHSSELGSLKQTFLPYDVPALIFCFGIFYTIGNINGEDKQMSFSGEMISSHYMGACYISFQLLFQEK